MEKWVLNMGTEIIETEVRLRYARRTGESIPAEGTAVK